MATHLADDDVMETQTVGALALVGDAEVDIQVATARRFPRSITTFMRRAQEMATLSVEIAGSCIYAIPRDGKTVEGPSARFAEMMMNAWGNMRAEGKTIGEDGQFVTARGVAWDLESNTAIGYEVKRRITDRGGRTYSADMITVTGNAGSSIALRNAILKAIPSPFWKPIYNACRKVVAGDAKTFATRRDNMLHEFAVMGVTEQRLCSAIGLKGKQDVTLEHMATLAGIFTALKDGDTTIEEVFPETAAGPQAAQRKSQQSTPNADAPAATGSAPAPAPPAPPATEPKVAAAAPNVGSVVDVQVRGDAALVKLSTGFQAATRDREIMQAAERLKGTATVVELATQPPKDPKYAPKITELTVRRDGDA